MTVIHKLYFQMMPIAFIANLLLKLPGSSSDLCSSSSFSDSDPSAQMAGLDSKTLLCFCICEASFFLFEPATR